MSAVLGEILVVVLLLIINGVFAMSELAIVSSRRARLQQHVNKGNTGARIALELAESPDQFLSTVQIGITLVGVLAGAFGGATIAEILGKQLSEIDWLAPYSEALGLGIVVATITYFSLVIGELVPKRVALQNPERIAVVVARPMRWLMLITYPLVRLLSASSDVAVWLLRFRPTASPPATEEEIRFLMEEGTQAGIFRESEQDMIESVFRLDEWYVSALMTPHTEIVWLDITDPPEQIRSKVIESRHSELPVCRDSLDRMLGMVRVKDLLAHYLSGEPMNLEAHLRPAHYVPETATAARVVEIFKQAEDQTVLVIDEYGGIQGLITEHDLLETLVGDIVSANADEPQIVQREDRSWLMDGMLHMDRFKEVTGIRTLPGEDRHSYQTLGGFVMYQMGQIPTAGQHFEWGGFRFEVVDMDGHRVDKVLVTPDGPPYSEPPEGVI